LDTARTRHADPTVADRRLQAHARSILLANPTGACVVALRVLGLAVKKADPKSAFCSQFPTDFTTKLATELLLAKPMPTQNTSVFFENHIFKQ